MTKSKFEAIASFPNDDGTSASITDDYTLNALRTEFAAIDFKPNDVMLLSSQFMLQAIHYGEPDDLFYYVWREPSGIFGASVWGMNLVPEKIDDIRVEARQVVEHRYFRPGRNTPSGTRVVGLVSKK